MGNFVLDKKTGTFVPAPSEAEKKVKDMAEAGKVNAGEIKDAVDIMNKTTQVKLASDASGLPKLDPTIHLGGDFDYIGGNFKFGDKAF